MGQKVHPTGFRLWTIEPWRSRWYANKKEYPRLLLQDARSAGELPETTRFRGLGGCQGEVERSFECPACTNRCQVTRFRAVSPGGESGEVRFFGDTTAIQVEPL